MRDVVDSDGLVVKKVAEDFAAKVSYPPPR